jgi:hypothetical protein
LTAGTDFATQPYQPEDAIFTQGRDYSLSRQQEDKGATLMCIQMIAEEKQEEGQVQSYE